MQIKDSKSREWTVSMSVAEYEKLCDVNDIDLLDSGTLSLFLQDFRTKLRVAYLLCEEQIKEHGLDVEEFNKGFSGETLDVLLDAVEEAVGNFIPTPKLRENYKATRGHLIATRDTMADAAEAKLNDPVAAENMQEEIRQACEEYMNSLDL